MMDASVMLKLAEVKRLVEKNTEAAQRVYERNPDLATRIEWLQHNPIYAYQPFYVQAGLLPDGNPKSSPFKFHNDRSKIRVVVTGNRCSKTYSAAAEVIAACIGINPITKKRVTRKGFEPPIDCWVISSTEETSIEIPQRTYADLIPWQHLDPKKAIFTEKTGWRGNYIPFRNGSGIRFKFSSQGRKSFEGTYKHKIHMDEEQPEEIYKECLARTTPAGGRPRGEIIITFTPIYDPAVGISWVHRDLYARRNEIPNLDFHFWTLFDVPDYIIPDDQKEELAASYDEDEREVRVFGMFTPVGLTLAFPRDLIKEQREKCETFVDGEIVVEERKKEIPKTDVTYLPEGVDPPMTEEVVEVPVFVPGDETGLRILREVVPGHHYALGADPAQGRTVSNDSDEQAFYVIDRDTWPYEVVAEFTGNLDPHEFGAMIYEVGQYYNWAYAGIENNADLTPIEYLRVNEYPNMHYQCVIEGRVYDKQTDKIGWNTNVRTRRKLRNDALRMLREKGIEIKSERILTQMETFARGKTGRWEAIQGAHDDRVLAWMIAVQMLEYAGLVDDWREEGLLESGPEVDPDRIYDAPRWGAVAEEAQPGSLDERFENHMARKDAARLATMSGLV